MRIHTVLIALIALASVADCGGSGSVGSDSYGGLPLRSECSGEHHVVDICVRLPGRGAALLGIDPERLDFVAQRQI